MSEQLLTIDEAAEALNVSRSSINAMRKRKELAFVKMGRTVRFRRSHIDRLIERKTRFDRGV